jgi:soluble lytic murein transglycosylase-like protein
MRRAANLQALTLGLALALTGLSAAVMARNPQADPGVRAALIQAVRQSDSFGDHFEAQVWLLDMSTRLQRYIPDAGERLDFLRAVHREAKRANLPPELVLAVIDVESRFDRFAVSRSGAQGYMQVMKFWVKEIGRPEDNLLRRDDNLRYGCTILRHYLDVEKNNVYRALGRYNGSLGRSEYPNLVLNALIKRWYKS